MKVSKKCQYALKALFELAWRDNGQPVKTHSIAQVQRMSVRFTEIILNELKHGGFVDSKRGSEGGYMLARDARDVRVGEVIEYVQGPISFVPESKSAADGALPGNEAFRQFWGEVNDAVSRVCGSRTFADLVELEKARREKSVPNYCI
ncbi:MAG: RrF2 family transcriptional regulator [Planctomycetota bacterium]|jgi:Rrf2 family protein